MHNIIICTTIRSLSSSFNIVVLQNIVCEQLINTAFYVTLYSRF